MPLKELIVLIRVVPVEVSWLSVAYVASRFPVNPVKAELREFILEIKVEPVDARLVMVA